MKRTAMIFTLGLPIFLIGCAGSPVTMAAHGHYPVPPDFDTSVELHPYTSHLGPCPEGVLGQRCANAISESHYNAPEYTALVVGTGNEFR